MSVATFRQGDSGYVGGQDTYIRDGASANTNFEDAGILAVKGGASSGFSRVALVSFDISSIPAGSTINSVKLEVMSNGTIQACTTYLYKILRTDWVPGQATWNIYKTSNNWTTAGARSDTNDMSGTWGTSTGQLASKTTAGTEADGTLVEFATSAAFVSAAQAALDGAGVLHLVLQPKTPVEDRNFNVYDNSISTKGPLLTVDYTAPAAGGQPPRSMHQFRMRRT